MAIETIAIHDLRNKTSNTSDIYYVTDKDKEGNWFYDSADSTSLDNEGTILVSTSGMRFKRIYDNGFVNAHWFFKNTDPDATLGIQRALDFISSTTAPFPFPNTAGGGTVFYQRGFIIYQQI